MTKPTEEAAKLAEKIATDIAWDFIDLGDDPDYRADQFRLRLIDELAPLYSKLAALEAKLAAEASAVEVREYVTNLLASERQRASGREVPSIDRGFQMALELVRNKFIKCEEAALRALTEAEGK